MIDWNRVIELRNEVGPSEFEPVLELFLDEVEGIVMRLSIDHPDALARDLHFLKGSAWNLGFARFGQVCDSFESRAVRGQVDVASLDQIVSCYATTKQMFFRDLPRMVRDSGSDKAGVA